MEGWWDLPKTTVMDAYAADKKQKSLTDQLLYAILAQLDKMNRSKWESQS
jgi:hypothetical protein